MRMPSKYWMLSCGLAALVAAAFVGRPEPAQAQFGINVGGFPIGIHIHPGYRGGRSGRRGRAPRDETRETRDESARGPKADQVAVSKGAPSSAEQTNVLKVRVASTAMTAAVGSTKDVNDTGQTASNERERDYTRKIEAIITRFNNEQRKARDNTPGDVTAHAIEQSLEKAFKSAKLEVFERFLGESWTAERLRTMILDRVESELAPLFQGNNRGNAPMDALDTMIQRSAESVYRRIFETSELLAANKSSSLFMQRLYQTHGALIDDQLRESADIMIMRASMGAIRRYEPLMRRSESGFAERYRAQRVVFDCLSENVEKISSSESGIATAGEIERRITTTSSEICGDWLANQFGTEKSELKAQKPMPLRVIWSATGPKDDPSMYGRSLSTF